MIIAIIYVTISFLLDGLISNYTAINIVNPSYFRTIFSVISLIVIYEYFDNEKKYLYILLVLGLLFDIVYTNTFILNIIIFLIIHLINKKIDYFLPNNTFTINIKSLISISLYHILTYIILILVNYNNYNIKLLYIILTRSIIMTIIYTTISYIILKKLYKFSDKQRIR